MKVTYDVCGFYFLSSLITLKHFTNSPTTRSLGWDKGVQENYCMKVPQQACPLIGGS